jgi:hypothetical protein
LLRIAEEPHLIDLAYNIVLPSRWPAHAQAQMLMIFKPFGSHTPPIQRHVCFWHRFLKYPLIPIGINNSTNCQSSACYLQAETHDDPKMKEPQVNSRARILRGLQGDKVSIEMVRVVGTIGAIRVSTLYYAQAHRHCPSHPQAAPRPNSSRIFNPLQSRLKPRTSSACPS